MSALLASRQSILVSKNVVRRNPAGVSRATAFRSQPRPFTGVAKATGKTPDFLQLLKEDDYDEDEISLDGFLTNAPEEAAAGDGKAKDPDDDVRTLGEGEAIDLSAEGDDDDSSGDMDADMVAALSLAKEIMSTKDIETLIEGEMGLCDNSEDLLENVLNSNSVGPALLAALGEGAPEVTEIEDYQGPAGLRKFDEEDGTGISEEEKAFLEDLKLDREKLEKLVPEDWDSLIMNWDDNTAEEIPLPEFRLIFLWQDKALAVAVDQVFAKGQTSPLTEYFFWPRKDAWEELRVAMETKPWITDGDKSLLLNRLTQVISLWQDDKQKHTVTEAIVAFPDCAFIGA